MYVLEAGASVIQLQFFPDGRRLLAGVQSPDQVVNFDVWTLPAGGRVRLRLPELKVDDWWYTGYGNAAAVHPTGERCYVAWAGRLAAFRTTDGAPLPVPRGVKAHQVVMSPVGDRLLAAHRTHTENKLYALTADDAGGAVVWQKAMPEHFRHIAGFLPDGERFVTIDDMVRIRTFADGQEQAAARIATLNTNRPHLSPDGRHLGVIGYASMYLYDTAALGKPRRITSTRSCGDFVSFAFHPGGRTLAVIHGGPTLVKVYDLETLRPAHTYKWKLGPLGCVAYSPDGALAAAGSHKGQIAVWDVGG